MDDAVVGVPSVNGGSNDCRFNLQGASNIQLDYTSVERDLLINGGVNGTNKIFLSGDHVGRNAAIQTGAGNDLVAIDETYFVGNLNIQTGGGNDTVVLGEYVDPHQNQANDKSAEYSVHADKIFVALGDGDDQLFVNNLYGYTNFDGGAGNDSMFHDDGQNLGKYTEQPISKASSTELHRHTLSTSRSKLKSSLPGFLWWQREFPWAQALRWRTGGRCLHCPY